MHTLSTTVPTGTPPIPRHALIGILAVSLAAVNSSLGGGLISAGLPDLRGAWGLGVDDAAYVPTAFNAAQMFMGPIAIILAARFGHRRVLLYCGIFYALCSLFLPFAPRTVLTLVLLVISGLTSGTFFPLSLSFIARNLPLRLITYGIAAYSMDLLGGLHVAQSIEGFYLDHLGWQWIFWNQAILTLPMLFCVYVGIPPTPKDQLLPQARFDSMLYISGALTTLYIALDQGERLDWFNNGLINGLLVGATLLFIAGYIQRKVHPYPFLDFSYLKTRNILLLGALFLAFRIILLQSSFIVPLFLERLQQYRPPEIGQLLAPSLIPYLVALPVIAHLMRRVHARYMLLFGFFGLGIINFYDAHALSTWNKDDFITQQMVGSVALCMAVMGIISGLVFEGRLTGAYRHREGAYVQGVFLQVVRLFGSEAAVSAVRRFILVREHFWQTKLVSGLASQWQFDDRVMHLGPALAPQAAGPLQQPQIAVGLIAKSVSDQAFTLAMDDSFMLLALVCGVAVIAIAMMRSIPLPHQLPDVTAAASAVPQHR